MIRRYTKINGLSWLRCPFWDRFHLEKFRIEDEAIQSKCMKLFHSGMSFGWWKRYNAVRTVITHINCQFYCIWSQLWCNNVCPVYYWDVTVFIMRSEIPFWCCASTPIKEMVCFATIMISKKNRLLKAPLSEWNFWIFIPNIAAYC